MWKLAASTEIQTSSGHKSPKVPILFRRSKIEKTDRSQKMDRWCVLTDFGGWVFSHSSDNKDVNGHIIERDRIKRLRQKERVSSVAPVCKYLLSDYVYDKKGRSI
jgi:hypothetical protein